MQLTREAIQRMCGAAGNIINGGGSGGFDPSTLAGFATETWVDENYVSIAFFSRLFQAKNGNTNINPNDTTSTIDSIKSMFGFWTDQYISALGQNSGGGGGGGATALSDLVDVSLTNPTSGQVLKYDGTNWINGSAASGTVTSISAGTGLTTNQSGGGAITGSGSISLSSASQTSLSHGDTAYGWGDHAQAGYASASAVQTLQGYFDASGNANSALKLTTVSKTAWGQTFWTSGGVPATISGDMTGVGNITMGNTKRLYIKDSNDNAMSLLTVDSGNNIVFGETADIDGCPVYARGNSFYWQYGTTNANRDTLMRLLTSGQLYLQKGTAGLRIGDGLITWDSSNNALKIQKADGSAANIYALGGVTALGFSAGGTGLDSATITTLLTSRINFDDTSNYLRKNATSNDMQLVAANNLALSCGSGKNITLNTNTQVDSSGYLHTTRVYLASNVYIYTDGSNAKLVIGSTTYTLTKS